MTQRTDPQTGAATGLAGKTVAILEARRSAELAKLIEHRGAQVFVAPALREVPVDETDEAVRFIDELCVGAFGLLIFLTGVGVRTFFAVAERLERTGDMRAALQRLPVLARGPKPVAALRALGLSPTLTVPSPYTSVQVLEALDGIALAGKRAGVVLHGGTSPEITSGLMARGAEVRDLQVYRWALPEDVRPIGALLERLEAGSIDAIAFTSASQVENLFVIAEQFGERDRLHRLLARVPVIAAVGPVSADALREHDLRVDVQPVEPKMGPLVLALDQKFAERAVAAGSGSTASPQ